MLENFTTYLSAMPLKYYYYEGVLISLLIGLPILFYLIKQITEIPPKFKFIKLGKFLQKTSLIIIPLLWIFLVVGAFYNPNQLIVDNYQINNKKLPKLKIAVISDLHLGPYKKSEWVQKIVDKTNNIKDLDAVFLPGDFLFGEVEFAEELAPLQNLNAPIIFATLGNHDHDTVEPRNTIVSKGVTAALKKFNIPELKNQNFFWKEQGIWVIGIDDNDLKYHDLSAAFQGTKKDEPKILLAHSPDIIDELNERYNPNLILSGHTHCGQVRLPFLGALPYMIPTQNGKKLEKHHYKIGKNQDLYITCGAGEVGTRLRIFSYPEISVLQIN